MTKHQGTVKFFCEKGAFGFIVPDGKTDAKENTVFFNLRSFRAGETRAPEAGQHIEYKTKTDEKGKTFADDIAGGTGWKLKEVAIHNSIHRCSKQTKDLQKRVERESKAQKKINQDQSKTNRQFADRFEKFEEKLDKVSEDTTDIKRALARIENSAGAPAPEKLIKRRRSEDGTPTPVDINFQRRDPIEDSSDDDDKAKNAGGNKAGGRGEESGSGDKGK